MTDTKIYTTLKRIASEWNEKRTPMVFDIQVGESASGRNGCYVYYNGVQEFVPGLSIQQARGFKRSMWAIMWGGSSKYLK